MFHVLIVQSMILWGSIGRDLFCSLLVGMSNGCVYLVFSPSCAALRFCGFLFMLVRCDYVFMGIGTIALGGH